MLPSHINLQASTRVWKTTPIRPCSASPSTITSLWFLSHCCSVDFCWNHCHRDKRCSKTACLLDLSRMKMLFIPHSLSFSLSFLLQQLQGQRLCLPSISLLCEVTLMATIIRWSKLHDVFFFHKCPQFCLTITMPVFSGQIHSCDLYVRQGWCESV